MRFFIKRNKRVALAALMALTMASAFLSAPLTASAATPQKETSRGNNGTSGLTTRTVFESLQVSPLEILNRNTRLDMLDYWDADSTFRAKNGMNGLSWIEAGDNDYLKVRLTPVSTFEIRILPGKKEATVMTIYTVGDSIQASDSEVDFYSQALQKLDKRNFLPIPSLKDFFEIPKGSATSMKEIEQLIPFPTVEYYAEPEGTSLNARLTVGNYMSIDDYNIVKLFLKPHITYVWDGKYKLLRK